MALDSHPCSSEAVIQYFPFDYNDAFLAFTCETSLRYTGNANMPTTTRVYIRLNFARPFPLSVLCTYPICVYVYMLQRKLLWTRIFTFVSAVVHIPLVITYFVMETVKMVVRLSRWPVLWVLKLKSSFILFASSQTSLKKYLRVDAQNCMEIMKFDLFRWLIRAYFKIYHRFCYVSHQRYLPRFLGIQSPAWPSYWFNIHYSRYDHAHHPV